MIWVRLMKWDRFFSKAEHKDVNITEFALWEPPSGGWFVCAIATTDKGLPPWDDEAVNGPAEGFKAALDAEGAELVSTDHVLVCHGCSRTDSDHSLFTADDGYLYHEGCEPKKEV